MSYTNPQPAVEALCGRTYTFRGKDIKNTNAAMLAVARCGVPLDKLQERMFEALPVAAWAMLSDVKEVAATLGRAETIYPKAVEFCADFTPEEMGELAGIYFDAISRFIGSFTSYTPPNDRNLGDETGNAGVRAVIS